MEFDRAAGFADQVNPWATAIAGKRFTGEELCQDGGGQVGFNGGEGELELLFMPCGGPATGFDGVNPRLGEVVDGEPERVIDEGVHRAIQDAQREGGGAFGGNFC